MLKYVKYIAAAGILTTQLACTSVQERKYGINIEKAGLLDVYAEITRQKDTHIWVGWYTGSRNANINNPCGNGNPIRTPIDFEAIISNNGVVRVIQDTEETSDLNDKGKLDRILEQLVPC